MYLRRQRANSLNSSILLTKDWQREKRSEDSNHQNEKWNMVCHYQLSRIYIKCSVWDILSLIYIMKLPSHKVGTGI